MFFNERPHALLPQQDGMLDGNRWHIESHSLVFLLADDLFQQIVGF